MIWPPFKSSVMCGIERLQKTKKDPRTSSRPEKQNLQLKQQGHEIIHNSFLIDQFFSLSLIVVLSKLYNKKLETHSSIQDT